MDVQQLARRLLVVSDFAPVGVARGDDTHVDSARVLFLESMHHHKMLMRRSQSGGDPTLLLIAVFVIIDRQG